jgi:hypothetical protein
MDLICIAVPGLLAWAVRMFARLVRLRNRVRSGWADIELAHDGSPLRLGFSSALQTG